MKIIPSQLRKEAQNVQLSRAERDHMREGILEYLEYKPLARPVLEHKPKRSGFGAFFRVHHFAGALAIALVVTTSTVSVGSAAADALPGDFLYPVKVNVNEGVKTVFITSDEGRIAWEQERAETRLREATQLASEGRLDGKRKDEVEKRFVAHSEAVVEQVRNVEESDPVLAAIASSEFEQSLETHEVVLARLAGEQEADTQEGVRSITEQMHHAAQSAGEVREAAEEKIALELGGAPDSIEDKPAPEEQTDSLAQGTVSEENDTESASSVEDKDIVEEDQSQYVAPGIRSPDTRVRTAYRAQESARTQLERAQTLLNTLDEVSELRAPARAQLASGNTHLAEAETALATDDYSTAYKAYRSAAVKFQKVAELLEVSELFSIEVAALSGSADEMGNTVELEAVAAFLDVPVVNEIPSGEEQDPTVVRSDVQSALREAQQLLLAHEGYDAGDLEDAYTNIARAERSLLRGDIYNALDDSKVALRFYTEAQTDTEATLAFLKASLDSGTVQKVPVLTPDASDTEPQDAGVEASSTVAVQHMFDAGVQTHTYVGEVAVATSCTNIATTLLVAESYPEQITLTLTTNATEQCEVPSPRAAFRASTTASSEAALVDVLLNGEHIEWVLLGEEGDAPQTEAAIRETSESSSFMTQTFKQAQKLLGGE